MHFTHSAFSQKWLFVQKMHPLRGNNGMDAITLQQEGSGLNLGWAFLFDFHILTTVCVHRFLFQYTVFLPQSHTVTCMFRLSGGLNYPWMWVWELMVHVSCDALGACPGILTCLGPMCTGISSSRYLQHCGVRNRYNNAWLDSNPPRPEKRIAQIIPQCKDNYKHARYCISKIRYAGTV